MTLRLVVRLPLPLAMQQRVVIDAATVGAWPVAGDLFHLEHSTSENRLCGPLCDDLPLPRVVGAEMTVDAVVVLIGNKSNRTARTSMDASTCNITGVSNGGNVS